MTRSKKPISKEANGAVYVCPSCLTRYRGEPSQPAGKARLCDYCRVPLVRENNDRKRLRCLHCRRRLITPEGVWCTLFETFPSPEEASCCNRFTARAAGRRARRSNERKS